MVFRNCQTDKHSVFLFTHIKVKYIFLDNGSTSDLEMRENAFPSIRPVQLAEVSFGLEIGPIR